MPLYDIEARGDAVEYYSVEAEDEDDVRAKFERGDVDGPFMTEINSAEIFRIVKTQD